MISYMCGVYCFEVAVIVLVNVTLS